jgi:hypothetical protein
VRKGIHAADVGQFMLQHSFATQGSPFTEFRRQYDGGIQHSRRQRNSGFTAHQERNVARNAQSSRSSAYLRIPSCIREQQGSAH